MGPFPQTATVCKTEKPHQYSLKTEKPQLKTAKTANRPGIIGTKIFQPYRWRTVFGIRQYLGDDKVIGVIFARYSAIYTRLGNENLKFHENLRRHHGNIKPYTPPPIQKSTLDIHTTIPYLIKYFPSKTFV